RSAGRVGCSTANQARPEARASVRTWPAWERSARECEASPPANSTARTMQVRASAFLSVAPWSVTRSMNSSYPRASPLNGSAPPIFAPLQVRQQHPVAEPLMADLEQGQAVPVEEEEQGLDAGPHGLDPVWGQGDLLRHLGGAAVIQAAFASEQIVGGQDAGRMAPRHDEREVRGGAACGHQAFDVAVGR